MKKKICSKISFCVLSFFIVVLLFSCEKAPRTEMTVLIRMMDIQDLWFREKIKEFEKENEVKLNVVTFDKVEDVKRMIELEVKSERRNIGLIKTAYEMVYPLAKEDFLIPLNQIVDSGGWKSMGS